MVTDFHVKFFRKYLFNCIILNKASSNKCTTEKLSSLLTPCCKTTLIHYKVFCEGIYRHTGVKCYWIVDNSNKVLKRLHNINIMFHRLNVLIVMILPRCIQISTQRFENEYI